MANPIIDKLWDLTNAMNDKMPLVRELGDPALRGAELDRRDAPRGGRGVPRRRQDRGRGSRDSDDDDDYDDDDDDEDYDDDERGGGAATAAAAAAARQRGASVHKSPSHDGPAARHGARQEERGN
ncbi:hypothetical protein JL720_8561 [Aureococcus anophagefferens]|nr:hypothetical protein JL720_8561 [Aureococcus anophagefferens]